MRVEVVISRLEAYIAFLIRYSFNQTSRLFHMFVKDLSHLIIKRKTIINKLLSRGDSMSFEMLKVFLHYFQSSLVNSDTTLTNAKVRFSYKYFSFFCLINCELSAEIFYLQLNLNKLNHTKKTFTVFIKKYGIISFQLENTTVYKIIFVQV